MENYREMKEEIIKRYSDLLRKYEIESAIFHDIEGIKERLGENHCVEALRVLLLEDVYEGIVMFKKERNVKYGLSWFLADLSVTPFSLEEKNIEKVIKECIKVTRKYAKSEDPEKGHYVCKHINGHGLLGHLGPFKTDDERLQFLREVHEKETIEDAYDYVNKIKRNS